MTALPSHTLRARNLVPDSDNKIHDDDVARQFGFTGALVPGVEVFAYATYPFAAAWAEDFLRRGLIDVRFRRPIYDGEDVLVEAAATEDGSHALTLTGPDSVVRALGHASLGDAPVDVGGFAETALPEVPPPADAESLAVGRRLGSVHEPVTEEAHTGYLDGVSDDLPLYRDAGFVHPGVLLRMVNAVLYRSVQLGPWIHTASSCQLLLPAPVPTTLTAHGVVTERYEKNGNSWVRFDALVQAGEQPVMRVDHLAIYALAAAS